MSEVAQIVDELSLRTCEAMLPGEFKRVTGDAPEPEQGLVAVIGFSGDVMRGVLGVTAPAEAIAETHPLAGQVEELCDEQLYDWIAELSNQLLGRIKGELMGYGVTLWLASPVVLRGVSIRIMSQPEVGVQKYTFHGRSGDLCVWIDYQYSEDTELTALPEEEQEHCVAGEMLLF